jgi:hypothetical protein
MFMSEQHAPGKLLLKILARIDGYHWKGVWDFGTVLTRRELGFQPITLRPSAAAQISMPGHIRVSLGCDHEIG